DRTTRPTGTDEVGSSECFVDDVRTALVADVPHRVLHDTRARALQQPGIEFDAAYGMLHARHAKVQPLDVDVQFLEREEPVRVRLDVDLEIPNDFRRNPAGAQLQSRKALLVEDQHIRAALHEAARSRRPRRTTADNENVTLL